MMPESMISQQWCTFYVDTFTVGIKLARVQEIIRFQRMTPVPLSPPSVRGLINLRGQIVTAIDLRRRLGLADLPEGRPPTNVVVRTELAPVSFLVDRVSNVVQISGSPSPPPRTLRGATEGLIEGVFQLKERLLLLLDVDAALEVA